MDVMVHEAFEWEGRLSLMTASWYMEELICIGYRARIGLSFSKRSSLLTVWRNSGEFMYALFPILFLFIFILLSKQCYFAYTNPHHQSLRII